MLHESFLLFYFFWGLFEQRNENPGRREKRTQQGREEKEKKNLKDIKGHRQGSRKRKQVALKIRERGIIIGQDIDMFLEYLSCTLGNQCRNYITFRETFAYSLLV